LTIHPPHFPKSTPPGAGHSSFDLIEAAKFFQELRLHRGMTLLDLGCGEGHYTWAAADVLGRRGTIYALDLWEPGIQALKERAAAAGRLNLKAMRVDISKALPLKDASVDLALMATVLHDLLEFDLADGALQEAARVLKPGGTLAIVEFHKVEGPPGPPLRVRLSPAEVEKIVAPFGFSPRRLTDVGPYNYLILFVKDQG
jgi:ubiquinone/menaquinone biosynthesis C-methylase UbiE